MLANFPAGTYNNAGFTQTFGNTVVPQRNPNLGFFVQDEWKVSSRLTLNLGMRYDLQYLKGMAADTNNFSLRSVANALLSSGNSTTITSASQLSIGLSPAQANAPVFPAILPSTALPGRGAGEFHYDECAFPECLFATGQLRD